MQIACCTYPVDEGWGRGVGRKKDKLLLKCAEPEMLYSVLLVVPTYTHIYTYIYMYFFDGPKCKWVFPALVLPDDDFLICLGRNKFAMCKFLDRFAFWAFLFGSLYIIC